MFTINLDTLSSGIHSMVVSLTSYTSPCLAQLSQPYLRLINTDPPSSSDDPSAQSHDGTVVEICRYPFGADIAALAATSTAVILWRLYRSNKSRTPRWKLHVVGTPTSSTDDDALHLAITDVISASQLAPGHSLRLERGDVIVFGGPKRVLFGCSSQTPAVSGTDVRLACLFYDSDHKLRGFLDADTPEDDAPPFTLAHSLLEPGSTLEIEGHRDDLQLVLDLPRVSSVISTLVLVLHAFSSSTTSPCFARTSFRLVNLSSSRSIAHAEATHHTPNNAAILCLLYRDPASQKWTLRSVGHPLVSPDYQGLSSAVRQHLSDSLPSVLRMAPGDALNFQGPRNIACTVGWSAPGVDISPACLLLDEQHRLLDVVDASTPRSSSGAITLFAKPRTPVPPSSSSAAPPDPPRHTIAVELPLVAAESAAMLVFALFVNEIPAHLLFTSASLSFYNLSNPDAPVQMAQCRTSIIGQTTTVVLAVLFPHPDAPGKWSLRAEGSTYTSMSPSYDALMPAIVADITRTLRDVIILHPSDVLSFHGPHEATVSLRWHRDTSANDQSPATPLPVIDAACLVFDDAAHLVAIVDPSSPEWGAIQYDDPEGPLALAAAQSHALSDRLSFTCHLPSMPAEVRVLVFSLTVRTDAQNAAHAALPVLETADVALSDTTDPDNPQHIAHYQARPSLSHNGPAASGLLLCTLYRDPLDRDHWKLQALGEPALGHKGRGREGQGERGREKHQVQQQGHVHLLQQGHVHLLQQGHIPLLT